ncbi:alkylhydroperoxidase domain protein [Microbacterium immunditiarum]|uniref:Alkylhydroperoxidase domain protein n=1 Tax=Microbacterium immunditiarum TaxID=337480 RepID=A0A7Y9KJA4_9MICO|nr:alkylhydroperoxidase domain protein [Microbacterium immunditiarum]NYE21442.1 alkylhydroperoxidase domain protein [Microbacterium immunditiarum]
MSETVATQVQTFTYDEPHPHAFTRGEVGWLPWLEPLPVDELTDRHYDGLVDRARASSDYFRLLARDPEILRARTLVDKDIFYNTAQGLPRAERELAAAAASRVNGCVFCASVHARFAAHFSKSPEFVDALLADGVKADLGERWDAITDAAAALTATPIAFGPAHVTRLRATGLDELEIADVIHGAAFFNWANRLMLSLGRPVAPPDQA